MPQQRQRNGEERSGKYGRPSASGGPLAQITNSAPAPATPRHFRFRKELGGQRWRSDLLLAIIGTAACLVSVSNLAWHLGGLPHSRHVKSSGTNRSGGGEEVPELKLRGKSALQAKLDAFVSSKDKRRTMRVQMVPNDGEGGESMRPNKGHERNPTNEGMKKRKGKTGRAPKFLSIDDLVAERVRKMRIERMEEEQATKNQAATRNKLKFAASENGAHDVHLNADPKIPAGKGAPVMQQNNVDPESKSAAKRAQDGHSNKKDDATTDTIIRKGNTSRTNPTNKRMKNGKGKMGRAPNIPTIGPHGHVQQFHDARVEAAPEAAAKQKQLLEERKEVAMEAVAMKQRAAAEEAAKKKQLEEELNQAAAEAAAKENAEVGKPDNGEDEPHPVAHLNCADHGGPTDPQIIDEMVFWSDIPSDSSYLSPMHPLNDPHTPDDVERFLTFEPDHGGWNNIRMAMETALVMSHAMGRTLVLPPEMQFYLLNKGGQNHQKQWSFNDFFHLDAISIEHRGFKVITTEEFVARVAKKGELEDAETGKPAYPPDVNMWGVKAGELFKYLRSVGNTPEWDPWKCALAIPSSTEPGAIAELEATHKSIMDGSYGKPRPTLEEFNGHPVPVNATLAERMREMLADRDNLCVYDKPLRESKLIHLKVANGVRLLTHFYAFVFFADWRQDLWSKRFVRDHLRYVDEIVCAAARVVEAVRGHARRNDRHEPSREEGIYDAMHVRRGDFQFGPTQLPAEKLYKLSERELFQNATLYVATDERNKDFFDVFRKHYDVVFLDDFANEVIPDVNPNYYGMIDQLVAYKSRVFYGTWWSTLSGYVNRMRGYYIAKHKLEGYKDGTMKSWYFTPAERVLQMRSYIPVRKPLYCREFPISWRDIDVGIKEIH